MSFQHLQNSSTMGNQGQSQPQNPRNILSSIIKSHADEAFMKSFPPGFRFKPRDEELVIHYLKPKLFNEPLPPHRIFEVQLYHHNPEILVGRESYGEGEWYFFTPRDKKYRNGSRPRRAAGEGYWKATGADRTLTYNDVEVGYRKALVFYRGKPPKGQKTDWMMHEYRLKDPPAVTDPSIHDMRLDDWVLCKIYKKMDKSLKIPNGQQVVGVGHENLPQQQGFLPLNDLGQLEEQHALSAMMLEQNSTLFLDNVSHYYDHSLTSMMSEPQFNFELSYDHQYP